MKISLELEENNEKQRRIRDSVLEKFETREAISVTLEGEEFQMIATEMEFERSSFKPGRILIELFGVRAPKA